MAVPSFVNIGTIANSASAATLTPTLPGSRVTNNIMIAYCEVLATGKTFGVGGGWTIEQTSNAGNISACWAWRLVDGTEAAPVFTWTGAAACRAGIHQFSGNATVSPIGTKVTPANANTSTVLTVAGIISTADNSLAIAIGVSSNTSSTSITTPSNWTGNQGGTTGGSINVMRGTIYDNGATSEAISTAVNSSNWASFGFELKGSGSAASNEGVERATQVTQEVLFDYGHDANILATQVVQEVMFDYGHDANILVTQVTIEVLRTEAEVTGGGAGNFGWIL